MGRGKEKRKDSSIKEGSGEMDIMHNYDYRG